MLPYKFPESRHSLESHDPFNSFANDRWQTGWHQGSASVGGSSGSGLFFRNNKCSEKPIADSSFIGQLDPPQISPSSYISSSIPLKWEDGDHSYSPPQERLSRNGGGEKVSEGQNFWSSTLSTVAAVAAAAMACAANTSEASNAYIESTPALSSIESSTSFRKEGELSADYAAVSNKIISALPPLPVQPLRDARTRTDADELKQTELTTDLEKMLNSKDLWSRSTHKGPHRR